MTAQELVENSYDVGTVSGVLQGIELSPSLLPNQKEAILYARQAVGRIEQRNKTWLKELASGIDKKPNKITSLEKRLMGKWKFYSPGLKTGGRTFKNWGNFGTKLALRHNWTAAEKRKRKKGGD